ncbi:MAG TPA: CarD family transcriptional regulator [Chondromyces sp.]|nr:CarD family transcriptional regulator [Chondromyces sp.]
MFNVGDLVIYSAHGICQIDEICKKNYFGAPNTYYVLHPLEDHQLTISVPVDNGQEGMLRMMNRDEAEDILKSFKSSGVRWIEKVHDRSKTYSDIIKTGNRKEISKVVNTLMRQQCEAERNEKKLAESDRKLLESVQKILFTELAISLDTTFDAIHEEVIRFIH